MHKLQPTHTVHGHDCHHGNGSFLSREWSHVKAHWLSCAMFCIVTHVIWHLAETVLEVAFN